MLSNSNIFFHDFFSRSSLVSLLKIFWSFNFLEMNLSFSDVEWTVLLLLSCDGRHSCTLMASPDFFGSDPCPKTRKYLETHYYCHNGTDKEEGNERPAGNVAPRPAPTPPDEG
jgi:hypothetical protein